MCQQLVWRWESMASQNSVPKVWEQHSEVHIAMGFGFWLS